MNIHILVFSLQYLRCWSGFELTRRISQFAINLRELAIRKNSKTNKLRCTKFVGKGKLNKNQCWHKNVTKSKWLKQATFANTFIWSFKLCFKYYNSMYFRLWLCLCLPVHIFCSLRVTSTLSCYIVHVLIKCSSLRII